MDSSPITAGLAVSAGLPLSAGLAGTAAAPATLAVKPAIAFLRSSPVTTFGSGAVSVVAPIEIIESEFPTRVMRFELIPDSGGAGAFRGGLGIRREYVNLQDARFSIRSTKHIIAPEGAAKGGKGRTGDIVVNAGREDQKRLPTRYADYPLKAQDVFCLDTPGGGGLGEALSREPARVASDVNEGYVTLEAAERDYGVVLARKGRGYDVDEAATAKLRAGRAAKA